MHRMLAPSDFFGGEFDEGYGISTYPFYVSFKHDELENFGTKQRFIAAVRARVIPVIST